MIHYFTYFKGYVFRSYTNLFGSDFVKKKKNPAFIILKTWCYFLKIRVYSFKNLIFLGGASFYKNKINISDYGAQK